MRAVKIRGGARNRMKGSFTKYQKKIILKEVKPKKKKMKNGEG